MQALDLMIPTVLIVILLPSRNIFANGKPKKFDYYTLAMQWPGTVCKLNQCPDYWTIHGLWPSVNKGPYAIDCGGILQPENIQDIKHELNHLWPNLIHKNNFAFWTGQWKKHGSCTENNPNKYFRDAIELARRYNIKEIFDENDMDANKPLQIVNIRNAMRARTGHNSKVKLCEGKVWEIHICYDKGLVNVINCYGNQQQQLLQQPQPLIQDNEEECPIFSNGQTRISFIAPILQLILILLCQQLFF